MRHRQVQKILPSLVLAFALLQSGMEAVNYVTLSWTKEGLRELRLAYNGKLLLATSLASVNSSNSVVFTRCTNGVRLVETVIRYGAIDDCIVSKSSEEVLLFSSDFAQILPGAMMDVEDDIMDVYLGIKNITDFVTFSTHSTHGDHTSPNTTFTSSNYTHPYTGYTATYSADGFHGWSRIVLSAKLTSSKTSSFMHMFKHHLHVVKMARECEHFQNQAAEKLEMLSKMLPYDSDEGSDSVEVNLDSKDTQTLPRPHRRRHHHGRYVRSLRGTQQQHHHADGYHVNTTETSLQVRYSYSHVSPHRDSEAKVVSTATGNSQEAYGGANDTVNKHKPSIAAPVSGDSAPPLTTNHQQIVPEYSTTKTQTTISLQNTSLANVRQETGSYRDDPYTAYTDDHTQDVTNVSLPSSLVASGDHRRKRDLLTGWMIFPGTKWCGDGDIAENKKDMGYHVELDKCCRRHDLCPLVISRLTWKYGMFNYRLHTLSHCRCDRKFRKCLKASSSPLAHLIGQIYFNVVGPQCFKFAKKSTCVQRYWWGGCREYANSKVAVTKKQRRFK